MGFARHKILLPCLVLAAAACEGSTQENVGSQAGDMFFENSVRRDASREEASLVAYLGMGCAAFFVENDQNKTYVVSAQHCFRGDIRRWCPDSGGQLSDLFGQRGRCTRVVATDDAHDIALFESDIPHASTGPTTLKLAAYTPPIGTRLVMIGFPGDNDPLTARQGRLTVTENCWTLSAEQPSPYADENSPSKDQTALHNCSTYGGNSGGPMFVEGTRDVIGLPFTYIPDDYTRRSSSDLSTAASLALVKDFTYAHWDELKAAGVGLSTL